MGTRYKTSELAAFIIPSLAGILLFMVPVQFDGNWTIVVKIIADAIGGVLADFLPLLCVLIVTVSAILGIASLGKPSFLVSYPVVDETFSATSVWAIIRCVGAVGVKNAAGMWFGVLPVVMCIGTLALVLATYTPVFSVLGMPFVPLLELLRVPEASLVSQTMVVGFTDMFTPSIIAASTIDDPKALFIVAVVSVTQLIYLSEVGGLILGSKIPVNIVELFVLFLERTIISLLIVAPIAHLAF